MKLIDVSPLLRWHDFIVVTHDETDFKAIQKAKPRLKVQNWVTTDYSNTN